MSRLVNGRTLNEVITQLRAYREPPHKTPDGKHKYFTAEELISAFDEIVGVCNYNVAYTDYSYRQISTGQEVFSVKCSISIISDDGEELLKRECYGGYECKYSNTTGKDVNIQNSSNTVCSYAFKNCASRFGVYGLKVSTAKESAQDTVSEEKPKASAEKNTASNSVMNFCTDGAFAKVGATDGRPVYKLAAHEIVGTKLKEQTSYIVFYPNQYSKTAESAKILNAYISRCEKGQTKIRILTKPLKPEKDGSLAYLFLGFDKAS